MQLLPTYMKQELNFLKYSSYNLKVITLLLCNLKITL